MTYETVLKKTETGIGTVAQRRPDNFNAFSRQCVEEFNARKRQSEWKGR